MGLDKQTKLPRFNMPSELGLFLATKEFGGDRYHKKVALILDRHGYRYREALSDIAGQDISVRSNAADAIRQVRDWLTHSGNVTLPRGTGPVPGGSYICAQYRKFV